MRSPRTRLFLLGALVVLTPALAGCNLKDWYNQLGDVKVFVAPVGASNSSIGDFRSLKLAVFGVTMKQILVVDTKEFSYGSSPLVMDMVTLGAKGERIELAQVKETIRPIESLTITLDVIEAVDAQGRSVPTCREGAVATSFPCIFLDQNGYIRFKDRNIAIPRGGTVEITMPLQVLTSTALGNDRPEYFLNSDQSQAIIENK